MLFDINSVPSEIRILEMFTKAHTGGHLGTTGSYLQICKVTLESKSRETLLK